jgi:hypothetical protein
MARGGTIPAAFFLTAAFCIIWPAAARSKTVQIDDSGTQALEPAVSLRWKTAAPSRTGGGNLMIGTSTVRVRMNVMPWLHRSGRIYLNLPAQPPGPIAVSWLTQGRLLPGQVNSGNRVLVYSGPITAPFMEDVLTLQFSIDGSLVQRTFPVTFHFEMDQE